MRSMTSELALAIMEKLHNLIRNNESYIAFLFVLSAFTLLVGRYVGMVRDILFLGYRISKHF